MKYTPRPWWIDDDCGYATGGDICIHAGAKNFHVCRVIGGIYINGKSTARANAHLIEAAPDLYEALEYLLFEMTTEYNDIALEEDACEKARTTIAKARGEAEESEE